MPYAYGQVEAALRKIVVVGEGEDAAFRSKLKRFRELGVPSADRPGTGARTDYNKNHVVQMAIAAVLSSLGMSPKWIKGNVDFSMSLLQKHRRKKTENDIFLAISPEGRVTGEIVGREDLTKYVNNETVYATSIVNLSSIATKVDALLD